MGQRRIVTGQKSRKLLRGLLVHIFKKGRYLFLLLMGEFAVNFRGDPQQLVWVFFGNRFTAELPPVVLGT